MARSPSRVPGRAGSLLKSSGSCALLALAGCASYEPAPLSLPEVLADLEARRYAPPSDETEAATPAQLAAFAVRRNPALEAARAQLGVARAQLAEAGRLSDPQLSWGAMDLVAAEVVTGTSSSLEVISGFGLQVPLPRPGELDADEEAARWRMRATLARLAEAEWALACEVHVACEDLREAQGLYEQTAGLAEVAERTRAWFARAEEAGAVTAIQANLARGDLLAIRADLIRREASLRGARQRLNALLGLPPETELALAENTAPPVPEDARALTAGAVTRRPDLAAWKADYLVAEEELRLAVARQYPLVAIGTGISIQVPLFRRFGRLEVATAAARRERVRRDVETRVAEARREVHAERLAVDAARRQLEFVEAELLTNAEASLRLMGLAFESGEATLLEILGVQRALLAARTRRVELTAELARHRWRLLSAAGLLLPPDPTPLDELREAEHEEDL